MKRIREGLLTVLALVLFGALALAFSPIMRAQTVQRDMVLSWALPTHDIEEVPLIGAKAITKIQIYLATAPIPETATPYRELFSATQTALSTSLAVPIGGRVYFRVRICHATKCNSALSEEISYAWDAEPKKATGLLIRPR